MIGDSAWIWIAGEQTEKNCYTVFRKSFEITGTVENADLAIAADSNFTVWLNGVRVPGGQFSDFAQKRTYSTFDIAQYLTAGKNTLAVRVHYIGEEFATYTTGKPGLIAELRLNGARLTGTDASWKGRCDHAFFDGPIAKVSLQLGYTFQYDARQEEPWQMPDYDDSRWMPAEIQAAGTDGYWQSLQPRPVEQLKEFAPPETEIIHAGYLYRSKEEVSPAESCFADLMRPVFWHTLTGGDGTIRPEPAAKLRDDNTYTAVMPVPENGPENGYYLIADLGKEQVGYIKFSLDAAEGTVVDIAHGEHLTDGRVRCHIESRHFADRYICKEGINSFLYPLRRIGARYLELHVTNAVRPPRWGYAGIVPVEYPLPEITPFRCNDHLNNHLHSVAVDTLKNCMHEHYEDCPWREQALYAYDSRNQILYGYYLWGNYPFAAASLNLLSGGLREDGYLAITAPRAPELTIPIFTFVWIVELYEYYLHSGDLSVFRSNRATVDTILQTALSRKGAGDFYESRRDKSVWNFCEWVEHLEMCDTFPQVPYNLYLYEALNAAAKLAEADGDSGSIYRQSAETLGRKIEDVFWDENAGCYATFCKDGKLQEHHEHIQVLMLYNGLVPAERRERVLQKLYSGELTGITFSALPYLPGAVMEQNETSRNWCAEKLANLFEPLILQNATSLWETPSGANDFSYAGSLCHGWSSLPAYFNQRYILGVRPLEPGFRTVEIKPYCGRFHEAAGEVMTPFGKIRIRWTRQDSGVALTAEVPEGITATFASYGEFPLGKVICNGRNCG